MPRRALDSLAPLALLVALPLSLPSALGQTPCGTFTETPVPVDPSWSRSWFSDVSALAADDAWAVGFYDVPKPGSGYETFTLAMHWDGSTWTKVPTPSPSPYPGGTQAYLHAVGMIAPDDVWAAGERYGDAGGLSVGAWIMVQHWDGSSWQEVSVPAPPGGAGINFSGTRIYDIAAIAKDDVWFGGLWAEPNQIAAVTWRPLAMHWDGSSLKVHPTPAIYSGGNGMHITSMSALASDDIWAVCKVNTASGTTTKTVVLHWDGSSWSQESIQDSSSHTCREIVAVAPGDVWVFGDYYYPSAPFALHYDGSQWTEVSSLPYTQAAAALSPNELYLASNTISLYDGASTAVVETFPGAGALSIRELLPYGACAMWAVGSKAQNGLKPFAARLQGVSSWTDVGLGKAGAQGVPQLAGQGGLAAGTPVQLALSKAAPFAPAALIVGASRVDAPLLGGTLVPAPDVVLAGLLTGANGGWSFGATWPSGVPAATSFWFQVWIPDAGALQGVAASNGLLAVTP